MTDRGGTIHRVSWPPRIGERLPNAQAAFGIQEKLIAYCLNLDHEIGAAKAKGFQTILGIGVADGEYLADALAAGVLHEPITNIRVNPPYGVLCEVQIQVAGLREHQDRVAGVTTSWELRHVQDPPRLVTAYIDG